MRDLRLRIIGLAAALATLAIAAALTIPALGGSLGSGRAAVSVSATERLAAGPYQLTITRTAEAGGERAEVRLSDAAGAPVAGKPLSGLLVYEGAAAGHEHHDILVSQEPAPGRYLLDLREAVPGPWLLTIVIGDEARAAYLFTVR